MKTEYMDLVEDLLESVSFAEDLAFSARHGGTDSITQADIDALKQAIELVNKAANIVN